jgi:hypothetical protein
MLRRSFLRSLAVAPTASLVQFPCGLVTDALAQPRSGMPQASPFQPSEPANSPIGVSKAIHPGRVVWIRDTEATSWDGKTGNWWDDACTTQRAVDRMTSRLVQEATGRKNGRQAWDALFRSFNETHKLGNSGYRPGEKIAIKINANQDRGPDWAHMFRPNGRPPGSANRAGAPAEAARSGGPPRGGASTEALNGLPSPHAVVALVSQLIDVAGVRGEDILIFDVAGGRNIGQPICSRIRANSDRNFQAVKFLASADYGLGGRIFPNVDKTNPIQFSKAEIPVAYLPQQVTEAKYMINMALLRPHGMAGVTLIGKNYFGTVHFPDNGGWTPAPLHSYVTRTQALGSYNALVDLIGHRHLGGKTMLYLLDGLYTAAHNEGNVFRWQSLGDQWASSMLISQDPIALDSVGLDILRSEPRATEVRGTAENYMHEAALAAKSPSGTVYNPDRSGALSSLGVHEHWNNSTDRKYSRNLGRKEGIELIAFV